MNNVAYIYLFGLLLITWSFISFIYPVLKEIARIYLTPTDYISNLPLERQVEVVGKTEGKTINSPMTQRACILWQIVVQESSVPYEQPRGILAYIIKSLERPAWVTTHIKTSPEPFAVQDETGRIQVLPAGTRLILRNNRESSSLFPLDLQIKNALERLDVETTDYLGNNKSLRVYEYIIEPAEKIYIRGEIKYENGVKTIATAKKFQQIISDHNQRELLGKFYLEAIVRIFLLALIIFIFFGILNLK